MYRVFCHVTRLFQQSWWDFIILAIWSERIVCRRDSRLDSRTISKAIRSRMRSIVRTRYTVFCIFRNLRLARSTAFDVEGNFLSSKKTKLRSTVDDSSFFNTSDNHLNRLNRLRNFCNLASAVAPRNVAHCQRRS